METENRREYLRAEVRFPAMSRVLSALEKKDRKVRSKAFYDLMDQIAPGSGEEPLYRCFEVINNKLDFIIDRLLYERQEEKDFNEVVEMSGSGLKFTSRRPLQPGDFVQMEVIIPESLQFRIEVVLQVGRVEERRTDGRESTYLVAGRYEGIDETSREEIIKTVFRTQRKMIRQEKINREEI